MEPVDKPDEKLLGTKESGLSGASGLGERLGSSPKKLGVTGKHPFSGYVTRDAVVAGKLELL